MGTLNETNNEIIEVQENEVLYQGKMIELLKDKLSYKDENINFLKNELLKLRKIIKNHELDKKRI